MQYSAGVLLEHHSDMFQHCQNPDIVLKGRLTGQVNLKFYGSQVNAIFLLVGILYLGKIGFTSDHQEKT